MSVFRRLIGRRKRSKEKEEDLPSPAPVEEATTTPTETSESTKETTREFVTKPEGSIVASTTELRVDREETMDLAKEAKITKHSTAEIVPGKLLKRDDQGRVHIKIVFYGPSLSGKTTALRWLFGHVRSLSKGRLVEIADELGRTTFFDFVPVTASERIVFDVFTVAGQRRHARSRISVLRDADGIIFMADSRPEMMNENLASLEELRIALGTDRLANMPIVVSLNKRDLPNALPVDYMVEMLDVEGHPIFETVATEGVNLLRMFQRVLRDALVFKVGI
ncbi:MAG: GTP-binding protein [Candidatus Thorarchaeota archaeon]